jgi:hypothetical protein
MDSVEGRLGMLRGALLLSCVAWFVPSSVMGQATPPPEMVRMFVKRSGLPSVRTVDVPFAVPRLKLVFFGVSYGREQDWGVYQSAIGLVYRGRIGWIAIEQSGYSTEEADSVKRAAEMFPLRPTDTSLMSERLLSTLDKQKDWLGGALRGFLARNGATPISVLRRLVRSYPGRNGVAQNRRLTDPSTPWSELITLAGFAPDIARAVLDRPDVRDNPERVFAIGQLPEYRGSWVVREMVQQQFGNFAEVLLRERSTPEPMLLQLFFSLRMSADTAAYRALYEYPGSQRNATLMTLFASDFRDPKSIARLAVDQIPRFGFETLDDAKLAFARRVRAEPSLPPASFIRAAEMAGRNWRPLMELYQIRGRDSSAERYVRESLSGSDAPLAILRTLAESLRVTPHYGVAAGLFFNRKTRKDRHILEIIAHLDPAHGRDVRGYADSVLRATPPQGSRE